MAEHTNQTQLIDTNPLYKCDFCEKKFKLNFSYNRHIQKYHSCQSNNSSSSSYECNKKSGKKSDYILSLQLSKYEGIWKSKNNNIHKCTICSEQCDSQNNLVKHMNQQHDQMHLEDSINTNTNVFKCEKCNTTFNKRENLNCHLLYCTISSRNVWNKFFSNAENNEINSYECTVCGVTFSHLLLLKSHMTSGCKSHSCSCCGKTFITKDLWLNHITDNEKYEECVKFNYSDNETSFNKVNLKQNDFKLKIEKEQDTDTNDSASSSDCAVADNYKDLTVQNVSRTLAVNNCSPDKNKEKISNISKINCKDTESYKNSNIQNTQSVSNISILSDCNPNLSNQNILPATIRKKNILDCSTDTKNTSDLIVNNVSQIVIMSGCSPNIKNENISVSMDADNSSDSIAQNLFQDSEVNNYCGLNTNKERNVCTTLTKRNISVCMDPENSSDSTLLNNLSQNLEVNNSRLIPSNVPEGNSADNSYSNHIQNSPCTTLPHNLIPKEEPEYLNSDNVERTNKYFSIKKLPNQNLSVIATNLNCEQISQPDVVDVFTCNICKMSSSTDKDSFALHMSSHPECGIHECVVCNQVFSNVKHWKDHMTYHQNQINLHLSELLQNRTEYSEAPMEPQTVLIIPKTEKNELLSEIKNEFKNSPMEIRRNQVRIKKCKSKFKCNICLKILPSKLILKAHRTIHSESLNTEPHTEQRPFCCRFCNMTFIYRGPFIKHEKLHNHSNGSKPFLPNAADVKLELKSHDSANESTEDKSAFCTKCNKQFGHYGALTNHMKIHSRGNLYTCNECDKKFRSKRILLRHINSHLKENLEDNIDIKNKKMGKKEQKQNSKNSSNDNNTQFACDVCKTKFSSADQLIAHRMIHKNKPYSCTICGRLYAYKFYWDTHLKNHYPVSKQIIKNSKSDRKNIFKCGNCKKEYTIKSEWKKHVLLSKKCCNHYNTNRSKSTSIQAKEDYNKCYICQKIYSTRFNLQVHLKKVHKQINSTNKNYHCDICSKQFLNSNNLQRHLTCIHSNEKIVCNICGKIYKHIKSYQLHFKNSKLHKEHNDKVFAKNKKQHAVSINKGSVTVKYVQIDAVQSKPDKQNATTKHVQDDGVQSTSNNQNVTAKLVQNDEDQNASQTSEKLNNILTKCKICFKLLKSQSYLSAHMRLHSGVKPYKCLYCNAQFRFKSNLRIHCKNIHCVKIKISNRV